MADDCTICGEPAERTFDRGQHFAYWHPQEPRCPRVCVDCFRRLDAEPEPETFDEALARRSQEPTR